MDIDSSEFEDWLIKHPKANWPSNYRIGKLTDIQLSIVKRNKNLLDNYERWKQKVANFEKMVRQEDGEIAQNHLRSKYAIRFDGLKFTSNSSCNFKDVYFPCSVSFVSTEFSKNNVSFLQTVFAFGDVSFEGASFGKHNVTFRGAKISRGSLNFRHTEFLGGTINFDNLEVSNGDFIFFPRAMKSKNASFSGSNINGKFQIHANFSGVVSYRGITVGGTADFSNCNFNEIPDFRDAIFNRPPIVSRMGVTRPKLGSKMWKIFPICGDYEIVTKCRMLKSMAMEARDHEKEGEFFRYEMLAKRGTESKKFIPLLFNILYGSLSEYGQNYRLPILWIAATIVCFTPVYWTFIGKALHWSEGLVLAIAISIRNGIPLVGSLITSVQTPSHNYLSSYQSSLNEIHAKGVNIDYINYFCTIEQICGGILLFLLILGLRNSFRIG